MAKTSMIAKLPCAAGKRDEVVAAFRELMPTVEGETGTELYSINLDSGDENAVWVFELYTDGDALAAHGGSDAIAAFFGTIGPMLDGAPELIMAEPVISKGHGL